MLTPREFQALERIHEQHLHRWAYGLAFNANIQGAKKKDGSQFTADDFIQTQESRARKLQAERDQRELRAFHANERRQIEQMKAGTFPEEQLPVWARMTPEEKAARGIK